MAAGKEVALHCGCRFYECMLAGRQVYRAKLQSCRRHDDEESGMRMTVVEVSTAQIVASVAICGLALALYAIAVIVWGSGGNHGH